ncbi:MAG: STAS/SEC14 domain-containing protein [Pseudomonadota bacterium]
MIEMMNFEARDTVGWRIESKVTEDDMEAVLAALRDAIEASDQVSVYQEITDFSGIEWEAIEEKMEFLREFGLRHFRKIAVVTDKRWMQTVIGWEDRLFRSIDMRAFSTDDRSRALSFLAYTGEGEDNASSRSNTD